MKTVWQNRTVKERAGKYIAGKGGGDSAGKDRTGVTRQRGKGRSMRRWDRTRQERAAEHWRTGQKRPMLDIMERTVRERAGQKGLDKCERK
jgi:hypothetical protein